MTKSIQSEVMTKTWEIFNGRTEVAFEEKYEDLDIYDFSEVLTFVWSEVKEVRQSKKEAAQRNSWKAPIGKKILEDSNITVEEYRSNSLKFVTSNKMNTANLFTTTDGRQIWLTSRQEEMISAYLRAVR